MTRARARLATTTSLRLVASAVALASLSLGAGWMTASVRDARAHESMEQMRMRATLDSAERSIAAYFEGLRAREADRPFYLYSHYYVPPDLLTISDAIATSPLADGHPTAPTIGWFQVDPDGTVRTPLTPEPSASPGALESRLRGIATSSALAELRASIAGHRSGDLVARVATPPEAPREEAATDEAEARATERASRAARTRRDPHVAALARNDGSDVRDPWAEASARDLAAAERNVAPALGTEIPPQAPLAVVMNLHANQLATDIQRAQAGDSESRERASQSTQAALVAQVVQQATNESNAIAAQSGHASSNRGVPPIEPVVQPASSASLSSANLERRALPISPMQPRTHAHVTAPASAELVDPWGAERVTSPALPSVPSEIDVAYTPLRWIDAGDALVLVRVVSSGLTSEPGEKSAVLQGAAFERADAMRVARERAASASATGSPITVVRDERGCALTRTNPAFPPRLSLCVRRADVAAAHRASRDAIRTDASVVVALVLVVLVALFAVHRLARREAELAQQRSDFVSAVSHELRTPLTTLRMHSEMLREGMVTESRVARVHAELANESARMARLVDNVLEASRLEAGRRVLSPRMGDPYDTVRRVVDEHRASASAHGMQLELSLAEPETSDASMRFDDAALERILANLVDNAIKYAEGSSNRAVQIRARRTRAGVELVVRDFGPGIPRSERERVFERFHRVQRPSDAHRPGTGLGLSLVRELARAHGGEASVVDVESEGTSVLVTLPEARTA